MIRALLTAAALSAALTGSAFAGDGPNAAMHFYLGCWRGAFAGSTTVTDDRCFAPMLGGAYLRDTHDVRGGPGPYGGETIYYEDAQAHRIAFTYYASDGGMSRGFVDVGQDGLITFPPGEYVGSDGATLTMRATWTPDGPNRYLAIAEVLENGQWREHLRIAYTRAPDLTPPR
ncbi:MAG: hypothetical protein ABUL73_06070 [Alphaproteobacteria bacterium]